MEDWQVVQWVASLLGLNTSTVVQKTPDQPYPQQTDYRIKAQSNCGQILTPEIINSMVSITPSGNLKPNAGNVITNRRKNVLDLLTKIRNKRLFRRTLSVVNSPRAVAERLPYSTKGVCTVRLRDTNVTQQTHSSVKPVLHAIMKGQTRLAYWHQSLVPGRRIIMTKLHKVMVLKTRLLFG